MQLFHLTSLEVYDPSDTLETQHSVHVTDEDARAALKALVPNAEYKSMAYAWKDGSRYYSISVYRGIDHLRPPIA
jgi:hypothetical protein